MLSLSPEKAQGFCQARQAFAGQWKLLDYLYIWSHNGTIFAPCGSSPKLFFFMLKLSLCFRNLPAPKAAGKFLVLECMWNVEPSWKFVWIFCVCVRCVLPLPVWHMRYGGLADRAFERGFRMPCWWGDSLAHILCQPSPRGFAVCVPKWHFWLMLSAASLGKGIEEKGGLANINEILMEGLFNNIKMWIWGVSQLAWGS